MIFIGDIHADTESLNLILSAIPTHEVVIQVGDLGLGFRGNNCETKFNHPNFHFIRGNHDSPLECRNHPNYLGEYGYNEKLGFFFVSGGFSIDYQHRKEFVSWWADEELSYSQSNAALEEYERVKPEIMVTHECPYDILERIGLNSGQIVANRTSSLLQMMWDIHKPKVWVFGHHHRGRNDTIQGTKFVCVDIMSTFRL